MKKISTIVTVCLIIAAILFLVHLQSSKGIATNPVNTSGESVGQVAAKKATPPTTLPNVTASVDKYPRWAGGRSISLNDPRWDIWRERQKTDPSWQGRMPIDFYGKVVEFTDGQPIADAKISFTWNDLSPAGSSKSETESDANGFFSLTDAVGKFLEVQISKDGYYGSHLNPHGFEYAEFSDQRFYQPDTGNPIVFRLRKKNPGVHLTYQQQELKIAVGSKATMPLDSGAQLQLELLANSRPGQGPWNLRISMSNGGLVGSAEEFPFTAPASDYQTSLLIDSNTATPPAWPRLYEGGQFYFNSGANFGRIIIEMVAGKDWLRIKEWENPSGSTNLEPDLTTEAQ